ncbi:MAG: helix-turn-helix domain-containing protein [Chitinophagaceae bacterium]|nr:helix-turn-helix domain-containing protein [Chitinophagaceae bacterium]
MAIEIITKEDLQQFKQELLSDLKQIFKSQSSEPVKQWLKSYEVRKMLGISRGTLQNMRTNGTLTANKIGGLMFYSYDDISKLMQGPKKQIKR